MNESLKGKFNIVKLNQNHHFRNICWIIAIVLLTIAVENSGIGFIDYLAFGIFILSFVFNYAIRKYKIVGDIIFYESHIVVIHDNLVKEIELSNEITISYKLGHFSGDHRILKALLTGSPYFDGIDNLITIRTELRDYCYRILMKDEKQEDFMMLYLNKLELKEHINIKIRKKLI